MQKSATISDLYCFALVLTKTPAQATALVEESVQEIFHRKLSGESARRIWWLIFQKVREKALNPLPQKMEPSQIVPSLIPGENSLPQIVRALHELPEPSRSAMTLFCMESFSLQDLESFLDLSTQELADALEMARSYLKRFPLSPPLQSNLEK